MVLRGGSDGEGRKDAAMHTEAAIRGLTDEWGRWMAQHDGMINGKVHNWPLA